MIVIIVTAVGCWPTARVLAKPRDGWRLRAGTCWRTATFLDSSFLSAPTRRHSCASEPTSGLDPLDRIFRTRQRQFRLHLFLQHFRGALPGHCGPLAEMLDSVTAKKVRSAGSSSNPALAISTRIQGIGDVFGDRLRRKKGGAASHDRLRATLREDCPDLPRITNGGLATREMGLIRAMHSRHRVRARWGYGDRNMDFATLPVMPESARRGREERHRTYHAVCR
jgi:hypothetical protein